MTLRYVELFAGGGGLSHGLDRAGWQCLAHAEIEPHARAVLRHNWPTTPLLGDVSVIDGTVWRGAVDAVTGGSPCQDLSVAGKRRGLEGARSGLFHQQARIWRESEAPLLVWENVLGALSSNQGRDFGVVLSTLIGVDVVTSGAVRPDKTGRIAWRRGGVAMGPDAMAAWRVFDLQFFGPPQRRTRVFVVAARGGTYDPAEILAVAESVCRHPSPRHQTRQNTTGTLAARTRGGGGLGTDFDLAGDVVATRLDGGRSHGAGDSYDNTPWLLDEGNAPVAEGMAGGQPVSGTLTSAYGTKWNGNGAQFSGDLFVADEGNAPIAETVLAFHPTQDPINGEVSPALGRTSGGMNVCVTGAVTHALTSEGCDASEDGTGRGTPIVIASGQANAELVEGGSPSLTCLHEAPIVFPPLAHGAHAAGPGGNGQDAERSAEAVLAAGVARPRRLTPRECERLMGWPDDWTRYGVREDGTRYELSDTARYRICGNGVGAPVSEWIGRRVTVGAS